MIGFVWAEGNNHVIGVDGHLPWNLPNDMQRFKQLTTGNIVVMGRKTFESLPNGPLPNRENFVVSRDVNYQVPKPAMVIQDIDYVQTLQDVDKDIMVIGGPGIFEMFKDVVDVLFVTKIHHDFDGDTFMIPIDYSEFKLIQKNEGMTDDLNIYPHTFETYMRLSDV